MAVQDYIDRDAVVLLKGRNKEDAFREMSELFCSCYEGLDPGTLLKKITEREQIISTWIARGIAIPHAIIPGFSPSRIALGISKGGVLYGAPDEEPVRLMVLIVGDGVEHLGVLRQVALRLSAPEVYDRIIGADDAASAYGFFTETDDRPSSLTGVKNEVSRGCFTHARRLAAEVKAKYVFVHTDSLDDLGFFSNEIGENIVLVTISQAEELRRMFPGNAVIQIPFKGVTRANQIELAVIFALSRGLMAKEERLVSVFGRPYSGVLDSIRVTDIDKEFKIFFSLNEGQNAGDLENQVLVRIIEIAGELAEEGREGKPSGTIFVLGDYQQVRHHTQQMIINPFKGYPEEDRNVLDPSLKETMKELSKIDGAFIIRGDGVLMSAGTYIRTRIPPAELPSGLGSRHAAAAAITAVSRSVSVALSESTRKISLFKNGERIMEL